ncbi:DUF5765 domain-containing protein [Yoonia sp.]|uniref:DUF5765 domain-containing protein n=1 Tax=Yoonia sp. TaxID=2212373 RepID=UPI002309AE87|nr:DUF5765 domain-containing protein [Yoonia sp.]MDA9979806.1 DUF5765 domain-containing protein [Yoonia sp.]MDB4112098.1 DUF5765 domain-containing protein [Yoonia sp.]MDB4240968.1 DUF5765 domain-containing protein [Yoonia sp.]
MCWNAEVSTLMVAVGTAATAISYRRKDPRAFWLTLGFFTVMEGLQVAGYAVLDQCGTPANKSVTMLSYLHIAVQPIFINAFALELVPSEVRQKARRLVFSICALSTIVMFLQIMPIAEFGSCLPGSALCADRLCTVSGDWHIAWDVPYNGLVLPLDRVLGIYAGFPTYMIAVFLLPMLYGAWRFVLMHAFVGPILASAMTTNPNEMPAIWCLFSIAILLIALSPAVRRQVSRPNSMRTAA